MTSITTPPAGRRRIPRTSLSTLQEQFVIEHVLERLGTSYGLAEDDPAIPYAATAERLGLSTLAAWQVGITLTPGHEIAQCRDCGDILDAALTEETDGAIRCTDCLAQHGTNTWWDDLAFAPRYAFA